MRATASLLAACAAWLSAGATAADPAPNTWRKVADGPAVWRELTKPGQTLPRFAGFVYDGKRDRMLFGYPGGRQEPGDGTLTVFRFEGRRLHKLSPANAALGRMTFVRELVYVVNTNRWAVWALRLDPEKVRVLEEAPRRTAQDRIGGRAPGERLAGHVRL